MLVTTLAVAWLLAAVALLSGCDNANTSDNADETPTEAVDASGTGLASPAPATDDGLIYPNIQIGGVDVGGLTVAEAKIKLADVLQRAFDESMVSFVYENEAQNLPFSDFAIHLDIDSAVQQAFVHTRLGADAQQNIAALDSTAFDIEPGCFYDTAAVLAALETMTEAIAAEPTEPLMQRANGEFVITPGTPGTKLDTDGALTAFADALKTYRGDSRVMLVSLAVTENPPRFSTADLTSATSLLGTWTTHYGSSTSDRAENIRLSANSVHNTYLLPGEVFSTNATFGPTTSARGYRPGGAYLNGRLVEAIGGGVCQTSSTLYRALLEAELRIVERTNHSLPVGYMVLGFDATLAGDYIDMKFENDTDLPILLETIMSGGSLTVNIYGHETRPSTRTIEFKNELVATIAPPAEQIIEDPTLPLGERVVVTAARSGSEYVVYKNVYENGQFVERVHVNTSRYRTVAAEVRVGTMPVDTTEPTNPAEPTDTPDAPLTTETPGDAVVPAPVESEAPVANEPAEQAPPINSDDQTLPGEEESDGPLMP